MLKILIIDDEKLIREGLVNYIDWKSLNIEVIGTASDGYPALQQIVEKSPDIVLSDIKMPSMDGIEMLKILKEKNIRLEVIFISAYSNFEYARNALKYGAFDYILKPIEENVLVEVIKRCQKKIEEARKNESLIYVSEEKRILNNIVGSMSGVSSTNTGKLVGMALEYIHNNYNKDIHLSDVANHLYISSSYLSKIFSEGTGESFSRYLLKHRIAMAKKLLADPRLKVYEVSAMVGYSDVCHFTKVFKETEGITPAKYKNKIT